MLPKDKVPPVATNFCDRFKVVLLYACSIVANLIVPSGWVTLVMLLLYPGKLEFKFIYEKLSEEQELVTFHEVLKKRGWEILL